MTVAPLPGGARQAALLLHTLAPPDRAWMLSQLEPVQRDEARRLLAELAELGVPSDPLLLKDVLGASTHDHAVPGTSANPSAVARVSSLSAGTVAALLQKEPDALVARLLRVSPWPWRDAVLDLLGATRRRRLQDAASTGMDTPRSATLDDALVEAFRARAAAATVPGAGAAPSWSQRLKQRWIHWKHRA